MNSDIQEPGDKHCYQGRNHRGQWIAHGYKVFEGGKDIVYGLADNAVNKAYTMAACEKTLPVKVTGTLSELKGKKTIAASKIEKT